MSLNGVISSASAALAKTQYGVSVTNTNVSNASDTNYARQTFVATSASATLALATGAVQRAGDAYLSRTLLTTTSTAAAAAKTSAYLQSYDAALGTISGGDDLSTLFNTLQTALTQLAGSPSSASAQSQAVSAFDTAARKLNALAATLDALSAQSNKDTQNNVDQANALLTKIGQLNDQIVAAPDDDTANLQEQRDAALRSLSGLVGIQTFAQADGRIGVYTQNGVQLVGATASQLSIAANASTTIISANGVAIDGSGLGGELGALVTLHDTTLPAERDKLDLIASGLIASANGVANTGSSLPAPQTLTGTRAIANASDTLAASGSARIALVDASGAVIASTDLDLSADATIGDLLNQLNSISGVSASISNGALSISSTNSAYGIAIGGMDSSVGADAQSFAHYFGLNDVLSGTNASTISVRAALAANASSLAIATLNNASTLTAGAIGLNATDSSLTSQFVALLDAPTSFPASGKAAAQTASLQSLTTTYVSSAASLIENANTASTQADTIRDAAQTRLSNLTGVNLDEETANLTQLQTQYQANAQLISVARDLFATLISMVNS